MTISNVQAWGHSSNNLQNPSRAMASVPTAGNVVVTILTIAHGAATVNSIDDSFGDGNAWTPISWNPITGGAQTTDLYAWWKIVGTPSGGAKSITVHLSASVSTTIFSAEYTGGAGITWSVDGTANAADAVGSSNPSPGALTTSGSGAWVIVGCVAVESSSTAGSGYTLEDSVFPFDWNGVEDKFTTASASETAAWTNAGTNKWVAGAFALKAAAVSSVSGTLLPMLGVG